ncbi:MAG: mucoidy inhibitor MuiA family protein, partial [Deltaproteobacteria bacterium]|nr:mucoidy inhibitor MuiA family protein [Deltaproteobacteria bacterium]
MARDEDERRAIELPVVRVTVLEDRAHVRREGAARLPAGLSRLRLDGVAPVLADKTLDVGVTGGTLAGARVRRHAIRQRSERPEVLAELESKIERLARDQAERQDAVERISTEQRGIDRVTSLTLGDIAHDVAWGKEEAAVWGARLDAVGARLVALRETRLDLQREIDDLGETLAHLRSQWAAADQPTSVVTCALELEVVLEQESEAQLRVEYVVPCAAWRPFHTAELVEGATTRVRWSTDGCVWQRTGEDWADVEILFSTERPSLGTEPPRLVSDVVRAVRKGPVVIEAREQEITQAGLGAGAPGRRLVPGIDDGGEVLLLGGRARTTVPSDGRPYRVPLSEMESDCELESVCVADLAAAVLVKTTQTNTASAPILAGPCDLVRESGPIGRTTTQFIAPGERFALGWGPDGDLRVSRDTERREEEPGVLTSWITTHHTVKVQISNLGPSAKVVHVTERVPVSEIEAVKVLFEPKSTTDAKDPDKDGFVRWTLRIPPFGR